jgi:hypothetical protein
MTPPPTFSLQGRALAAMGEQLRAERDKVTKAEAERDDLRRSCRVVLHLFLEAMREAKLPPALEQRLVAWATTRSTYIKEQDQCRKDGHGRTECVDCGAELVGLETVRDRQRIAQLMEDTVEPEGTGPVS